MDDEFWEKCKKGPITQKDLPSYNQVSSSFFDSDKKGEEKKPVYSGSQYLYYELNNKTVKKDEECEEE
ncbi:MAG: hypothetical protein LUG83_10930 [Lachnospiraceae bacterium]|nr:hypothetical protein [Lachnospiraceae bacterium]